MKDYDVSKLTGQWLKVKRVAKGLSQQQLSTKVGRKETWYTDIERGRSNISWKDLIKLSEILDFDIIELKQYLDNLGKKMTDLELQGKVLETLRKDAKKTQEQGAKVCGHGRSWINEIEKGRVDIKLSDARKIVESYGFTLNDYVSLYDKFLNK